MQLKKLISMVRKMTRLDTDLFTIFIPKIRDFQSSWRQRSPFLSRERRRREYLVSCMMRGRTVHTTIFECKLVLAWIAVSEPTVFGTLCPCLQAVYRRLPRIACPIGNECRYRRCELLNKVNRYEERKIQVWENSPCHSTYWRS